MSTMAEGNEDCRVRSEWEAAAAGWGAETPIIRPWLEAATQEMIRRAGIRSGSRVLDVAAGAGDQTGDIARLTGSAGRVLAVDLAPSLVGRLRERLDRDRLTGVEARVADAQDPLPEVEAFDAAVCRLGLMLMAEPDRCARSVRRALRPGGVFAALVFAGPDRNPCLRILIETVVEHAGLQGLDPFRPGSLFSLGPPGRIEAVFASAGFADVASSVIDAPFRLPSVDRYIDFVRSAGGPVRSLLSPFGQDRREAAWRDAAERLRVFDRDGGWVGPNSLILAVGTA